MRYRNLLGAVDQRMSRRRFSVVLTFQGHYSRDSGSLGGIFKHLEQAVKERDRRNARDARTRNTPEDILRRGGDKYIYRWRVLDLGARKYAD